MGNPQSSYWISHVRKNSGQLDSLERISEVIFGLIMVLTFTCTIRAMNPSEHEVKIILWSALGCNVAWGVVDAFMFLFSVLMYRGESLDMLHVIHKAKNQKDAEETIKEALPPIVSQLLKEEHYEYLRAEIAKLPEPPSKTFATWNDFKGALQIFFLVFISTFPVVIPFVFISDIFIATRVSNGIALLLLFATGYYFGKKTKHKPVRTGLLLMLIGTLLVAATIALGG